MGEIRDKAEGGGVEGRRRALLALVESRAVGSQEELAALLAARGFPATQSSVSRDLRALGVSKVQGVYARDPRSEEVLPMPLVAAGMHAVAPAGPHLVVVHTASGLASAVCAAIDEARWPEVVGTLAGNDTIFCACRGRAEQARLLARLRAVLAHGRGPVGEGRR